MFPLGYFLCFHLVGKIAQIVYKKMVQKCCKRKVRFNPVEAQNVTTHATAPKSNRITQPSYTFFVVPHPSEAQSEQSPLISDTGYGSTISSYVLVES